MTANENVIVGVLIIIAIGLTVLFVSTNVNAADPEGPDEINVISNTTKGTVSARMLNISGGRIAILFPYR